MSRIEPEEPAFDPSDWSRADAQAHWLKGVSMFNAGRYEEAHEAFEMIWLSTQGSESDFFKGLIQASIALHHFSNGNLDSAAKLYGSHRSYLAAFSPAHRGIDVASFLTEMQRTLRAVARRRPGDELGSLEAGRPMLRSISD